MKVIDEGGEGFRILLKEKTYSDTCLNGKENFI